MGSLRLTVCTGILAAAVLTPAAHAADGGSVSVTPAVPAPGSDVSLHVNGCPGKLGTAVSRAFVSDASLTGTQGALAGETRVRSSLAPGTYDVQISCGDYVVTGRVTVGGSGSGQSGEPTGSHASPVAPVPAGGGGTAHFATVATSGSGPDTAQAVTGLALAGVAAAVFGLRARRSRGTR
ncbi:hypothetical protein ACIHEJ_16840 [Streptomyces sp. NPDC052301]|uniref:hypothetical protein n=1 Tax=Streptomyces sp. NPDC052301 TaxID=3365687 RepID=UPI0037CEB7FC